MPTQFKTQRTTIVKIMKDSAFALGVYEYRAGLPLRDDRRRRTMDSYVEQWNYERGRAWAAVAPRTMPLIINGKLNPAAIRIARDAVL
jgi:hypothetical protein